MPCSSPLTRAINQDLASSHGLRFDCFPWLVGWLHGSHAGFQGSRVNDRLSKGDGSWMAFFFHRLLIDDRVACDGILGLRCWITCSGCCEGFGEETSAWRMRWDVRIWFGLTGRRDTTIECHLRFLVVLRLNDLRLCLRVTFYNVRLLSFLHTTIGQ